MGNTDSALRAAAGAALVRQASDVAPPSQELLERIAMVEAEAVDSSSSNTWAARAWHVLKTLADVIPFETVTRFPFDMAVNVHDLTVQELARCVDFMAWRNSQDCVWVAAQLEHLSAASLKHAVRSNEWCGVGNIAYLSLHTADAEHRKQLTALLTAALSAAAADHVVVDVALAAAVSTTADSSKPQRV